MRCSNDKREPCVLKCNYAFLLFFFFFQAEDGIRDYKVTGVQTCALPILMAVCFVDQHEPQHVHEANGHQHRQALHRLAPTPRTTALSTIRITPNPAATPSSDTRRLDMISIAMGRLSGV